MSLYITNWPPRHSHYQCNVLEHLSLLHRCIVISTTKVFFLQRTGIYCAHKPEIYMLKHAQNGNITLWCCMLGIIDLQTKDTWTWMGKYKCYWTHCRFWEVIILQFKIRAKANLAEVILLKSMIWTPTLHTPKSWPTWSVIVKKKHIWNFGMVVILK